MSRHASRMSNSPEKARRVSQLYGGADFSVGNSPTASVSSPVRMRPASNGSPLAILNGSLPASAGPFGSPARPRNFSSMTSENGPRPLILPLAHEQLERKKRRADLGTRQVAGSILLNWLVGISANLLLAKFLTASEYRFPHAFTIFAFQGLTALAIFVGWRYYQNRKSWKSSALLPHLKAVMTNRPMLNVAAIYLTMIISNQKMTQYSEPSTIHLYRALSIPVMFVLQAYIFLEDGVNKRAVQLAVSIAASIVMTGFPFSSITFSSLAWGFVNAISIPAFAILVKDRLESNSMQIVPMLLDLLLLSTPVHALLAVLSGEVVDIWFNIHFFGEINFWVLMIFESSLVLSILLAGINQIKYLSPLNSMISTTLRTCVQAIVLSVLYGSPIGWANVLSIIVAFILTKFYLDAIDVDVFREETWLKLME